MNLTETSVLVKKSLKYFLAAFFGYYFFILIVIPSSQTLLRSIFMTQNPPTPVYGILPQLEFIEKPITNEAPEYVLETVNGKLPTNIPYKMNVYKIEPDPFLYQAGQVASEDAKKLGFSDADLYSDLKESVYKWRNSAYQAILEIDTNTKDIIQKINLTGKGKYYSKGSISSEKAIKNFQKTLTNIDRFSDSKYVEGEAVTKRGTFSGNFPTETDDLNAVQLVRVDLFRSIEKEYKILGPDPRKGLLHAVIGNFSPDYSPLNNPELEIYYSEIEEKTKASYPLITVQDAWKAISQNKGVITNVTPNGSNPFKEYTAVQVDRVLVDNIYIAYYENPESSKFLQPIYVFEGKYTSTKSGDGEITIYFPAITGEYIQKSQSQE